MDVTLATTEYLCGPLDAFKILALCVLPYTHHMVMSELTLVAHCFLKWWQIVDCDSLGILLAVHCVWITTTSLWQQSIDHQPTADDHQEDQATPGSERSRMTWNLWISVLPWPGWRQLIKMLGVQLCTDILNAWVMSMLCHKSVSPARAWS